MNQAHLENGTYAQIDKNLEKVLELNGLETLDELETNTLGQYATKNSEKPKPTWHHCKKPRHYNNQSHQLKKQEKTSCEHENQFWKEQWCTYKL